MPTAGKHAAFAEGWSGQDWAASLLFTIVIAECFGLCCCHGESSDEYISMLHRSRRFISHLNARALALKTGGNLQDKHMPSGCLSIAGWLGVGALIGLVSLHPVVAKV